MFKYDSTHGKFEGDIKVEGGQLIVNGAAIAVYAEWVLITPENNPQNKDS